MRRPDSRCLPLQYAPRCAHLRIPGADEVRISLRVDLPDTFLVVCSALATGDGLLACNVRDKHLDFAFLGAPGLYEVEIATLNVKMPIGGSCRAELACLVEVGGKVLLVVSLVYLDEFRGNILHLDETEAIVIDGKNAAACLLDAEPEGTVDVPCREFRLGGHAMNLYGTAIGVFGLDEIQVTAFDYPCAVVGIVESSWRGYLSIEGIVARLGIYSVTFC